MPTPTPHPPYIDRYQVLGLAGKGGMARVYRAWDPKHRRVVAIKMMNPELRQEPDAVRRFRRSARALYQLQHENITRVYGASDHDGIPCLVMEYIDGVSLDRYLAGGQPMAPRKVALIMDQVSQALDYAHSRGIVHRDIKPSNILLTRDGQRAVLSDFGVALVLGQSRLTLPGIVLGTPQYMSPEQVRGVNMDWRADIYALGVTCYELLTGRPAFRGKMMEVAAQIVNGHYRPPTQVNPALPGAVDDVIHRALQPRPEHRYQRASQFSQALSVSLGFGRVSPTPQPRKDTRLPGRRTNWSNIMLILVCVVVIVSAIWFLALLIGGGQ